MLRPDNGKIYYDFCRVLFTLKIISLGKWNELYNRMFEKLK